MKRESLMRELGEDPGPQDENAAEAQPASEQPAGALPDYMAAAVAELTAETPEQPAGALPDYMAATVAELTAEAPAPAAAPERTYTVQPGDSLSAIALEVYGEAGRWPEILAANSDTVQDANLIFPGQVLRIP